MLLSPNSRVTEGKLSWVTLDHEVFDKTHYGASACGVQAILGGSLGWAHSGSLLPRRGGAGELALRNGWRPVLHGNIL